jgi:3'-phosphoadenosine 5'-phosphosulfate sulfotransferase (PAPS reductase)/FAD synthetase
VTIDTFRLAAPAVVNVSGGRTSALLLRRVMDAHGGRLPPGVFAVFANTGDEHPRTLEFLSELAVAWGVDLRWIERDRSLEHGFAEVTFETASRCAEPFSDLIRQRRFLPNATARFCTVELKIEAMRAFMRAQGFDHWTSAVGLRFDEARRVAQHRERQREEEDFDSVYPLHRARVTREDVEAFWRGQPFDLGLPPWASNCRGCFLKSRSILERTERDAPGALSWWAQREAEVGGTFVRGRRYLDVIADAARPMLPMALDGEEVSLACSCTDRRRPRRCSCRRRRGEGHALTCSTVLGGAS